MNLIIPVRGCDYWTNMIRYSRACISFKLGRWSLLTRKLQNQKFIVLNLKSSLQRFCGRHHNLLNCYRGSASQMITDMSRMSQSQMITDMFRMSQSQMTMTIFRLSYPQSRSSFLAQVQKLTDTCQMNNHMLFSRVLITFACHTICMNGLLSVGKSTSSFVHVSNY